LFLLLASTPTTSGPGSSPVAAPGLRAGELHALRCQHIDMVGAEAKIETRVDAYGEEDVTKTAGGMRTVFASIVLVDQP
jgi:hypothetical protein